MLAMTSERVVLIRDPRPPAPADPARVKRYRLARVRVARLREPAALHAHLARAYD
jgi:hypothetical protein